MEPQLPTNDRPITGVESQEAIGVSDRGPEGTPDNKVGSIVGFVEDKFQRAKSARYYDEQRWLRAYRNYRGIYGPDVQFLETEKSRVFVKVTKTKVLASYGQIVDVLFGSDKFPIGVSPTVLPEGIADAVHFDLQESPATSAEEPQEMPKLRPGETRQQLKERLGPLGKTLAPVMDKLKEGPGTTPSQVTYHPADIAAKSMEKKILDQLDENEANKKLRSTAFESCLFGSGVMKGPFVDNKEYAKWSEKGEYTPINKTIPYLDYVSIWNSYPDPDASCMSECEHFIERHKLSRTKLRQLGSRPFFRKKAIEAAIKRGENYVEQWWESHIEEGQTEGGKVERFEAFEYWGFVDTDVLEEHGLKLPPELRDSDQVSINCWICNGEVLRLVLNPYKPEYIPYYIVPYEVNPYSIFGVGIAENMDDTQTLMNGFMRLAVDNAALSGNIMIEVDENNLVPGQDMKVYPGKIWRRSGGAPGQAIFGTKFPNVSQENLQLFDKARQLADESTGLASFAHGQTGVTGVGRTSSGISMLMSAANGAIRTVVKNFDDYLLAPLGKALFHFNMQFNFDENIVGDLEVKARGTESLMANEIRSQRLMQFMQVGMSPATAPMMKMDYILREIAKSMDLDPDKVTNNLADAALQAKLIEKYQAASGQAPAAPPGGPPNPQDTSGAGNGNIGIGQSPVPGEDGFTGNPGGNGGVPI